MNPCEWCGGEATVMKRVVTYRPACDPCANARLPVGPDDASRHRFRSLTIDDLLAIVDVIEAEVGYRHGRAPRERT